MFDWRDLSYLQTGTSRQQAAWQALFRTGVMAVLQPYDPVLAGTLPLQIDVDDSDLDIICECQDLDQFEASVRAAYEEKDGYAEERHFVGGVETGIIRFFSDGFWFELFAQPILVERQNAYRHMVLEARLLELGGPEARREIHLLKQQGIKTEPAFARYFGIPGEDPYLSLLRLEIFTDEQLRELVKAKTS